jgi:hypothetical protein
MLPARVDYVESPPASGPVEHGSDSTRPVFDHRNDDLLPTMILLRELFTKETAAITISGSHGLFSERGLLSEPKSRCSIDRSVDHMVHSRGPPRDSGLPKKSLKRICLLHGLSCLITMKLTARRTAALFSSPQ